MDTTSDKDKNKDTMVQNPMSFGMMEKRRKDKCRRKKEKIVRGVAVFESLKHSSFYWLVPLNVSILQVKIY